jgi:hypothetical protein
MESARPLAGNTLRDFDSRGGDAVPSPAQDGKTVAQTNPAPSLLRLPYLPQRGDTL